MYYEKLLKVFTVLQLVNFHYVTRLTCRRRVPTWYADVHQGRISVNVTDKMRGSAAVFSRTLFTDGSLTQCQLCKVTLSSAYIAKSKSINQLVNQSSIFKVI